MLYFSRADSPGHLKSDKISLRNSPSSGFDLDLGQDICSIFPLPFSSILNTNFCIRNVYGYTTKLWHWKSHKDYDWKVSEEKEVVISPCNVTKHHKCHNTNLQEEWYWKISLPLPERTCLNTNSIWLTGGNKTKKKNFLKVKKKIFKCVFSNVGKIHLASVGSDRNKII